jgi:hypothetical protein
MVQHEAAWRLVRVLIQMIDAAGIELRATSLDAMDEEYGLDGL